MIIQRLKLVNFRSHQNSEFFFRDRIVFILGLDRDFNTANFAGKTSVLKAIVYGLYGKTDLPSRCLIQTGSAQMSVELDLQVNNQLIQIQRIRTDSQTRLNVTIQGEELKGTQTELQEQLDKLLKMSYEQFINYSLVDNINFSDMGDLSSRELKNLLTELVQLNKIQNIITRFKSMVTSLKFSMSQFRSSHFPSKTRLETLVKSEQQYLSTLQEVEQHLDDRHQKLGQLNAEKQNLNLRLQDIKQKLQIILSNSQCPVCLTNLSPEVKTAVLNYYQTLINETQQLLNSSDASDSKECQADLEATRQTLLFRLNRITAAKAKLEETMKLKNKSDNLLETYELYTQGVKVLNQYLSFALTYLGQHLENLMNVELARFGDLSCKLNLFKIQADGQIVPSCYLSVIKNDVEYQYNMLSGGERSILALLFKLALNDLQGSSSIFLLDEGLDRLDDTNREKILDVLDSSSLSQIFIISHKMNLTRLNYQKVYIVKKDGISTVQDYI